MSIPWDKIVNFHREVIKLGEDGFYSLPGGGHSSTRWSFLQDFSPDQMVGPWHLDGAQFSSAPFLESSKVGEHEELFLGAGCVEHLNRGKIENRPLFIREVRLEHSGTKWLIQPQSGRWDIAPTFFSLLDRLQIDPKGDVEDLGTRLIERATQRAQREERRLTELLRDVIAEEYPEASDRLIASPTGWVVFGHTNKISPFNTHLMRDYDRLIRCFEHNPNETGGLRVLEGLGDVDAEETDPPLDFVPLNPSQREAVKGLLGGQHVSVISGPPGCGKSQVVVSTLLNAWARGLKVLFASNNNRAVDVVLERLERFEAQYPVAVRAGAKSKSRVLATFGKTQTIIERFRRDSKAPDDSGRIDKLLAMKRDIQEMLDGAVPAQVDQQLKSALKAYGEFQAKTQERIDVRAKFQQQLESLGVGSVDPETAVKFAGQLETWIGLVPEFEKRIEADLLDRQEHMEKQRIAELDRDAGCKLAGLNPVQVRDWNWLLEEGPIQILQKWWQSLQECLERPLEQDLKEFSWSPGNEKWSSSSDAAKWKRRARALAAGVRREAIALAALQAEIEIVHDEVKQQRSSLLALGLSPDSHVDIEALTSWANAYKESSEFRGSWSQWIPWSPAWSARGKLGRAQSILRPLIPITLWKEAIVSQESVDTVLCPSVEGLILWHELQLRWAELSDSRNHLNNVISGTVNETAELGLGSPDSQDIGTGWPALADDCERAANEAGVAAKAWEQRERRESTERTLRSLADDLERIGAGMPIREAFFQGQGRRLSQAMQRVADEPSPSELRALRLAQHEQSLPKLLNGWRMAWEHHRKSLEWEGLMCAVPTIRDRVADWWTRRPENCAGLGRMPEAMPSGDCPVLSAVAKLSEWVSKWTAFVDVTEPELHSKIQLESEWALKELQKAVESIPEQDRQAIAENVGKLVTGKAVWPTGELADLFKPFSPARLKARVESLDSQLEALSFTKAKTAWLERTSVNREGLNAVSALGASLSRSNLAIRDQDHELFQAALDVLPIWVVTGQSAHTLPVSPACFDLIIIDEASQCSLTNLLPLLYRAKRVGIIGDPNQLPAIPVITPLMEQALLQRLNLEDYGLRFGHASNDVYKVGVSCLPNREGDVVGLEEHYRSHPLIIGFSNQHIYHQALRLRREPFGRKMNDYPPGVYQLEIAGHAARKGSSWINQPEADEVVVLLRLLQASAGRRSIGVVTPFRAQTDLLTSMCVDNGLDNIQVGTAHTYQGDERDIMVFSPVVAPGMPPGTVAWAGNPNQVNVAVTRAREVFIMAGHLTYCSADDGILGDLARYCQTIQKLRETSPAELQLYSYLTLEGIDSKVHQVIGDLEVDFVISSTQGPLVIEVDGDESHRNTVAADQARDAFLHASGYTVLRFSARQVLETVAWVMREIKEAMGLSDLE